MKLTWLGFLSFVGVTKAEEFCQNGLLLHKMVCIPENYAKTELPSGLVDVEVGFQFFDVPTINVHDLTLTVSMYLHLSWLEPKLITNFSSRDEGTAINTLAIEQHLWKPDIFIRYFTTTLKISMGNNSDFIVTWSSTRK